jgi:hypothetical protein
MSNDTPQRLSLGADSWTANMAKLDVERTEYERWKEVSYSTHCDELTER